MLIRLHLLFITHFHIHNVVVGGRLVTTPFNHSTNA